MPLIVHYIDLIWLPLALLFPRNGQKLVAGAFVASCILMMRMQIELVELVGFNHGFLGIIHADALTRGLVIYTTIYIVYLATLRFSPNCKGAILIATSIGTFFTAFTVSMIAMLV